MIAFPPKLDEFNSMQVGFTDAVTDIFVSFIPVIAIKSTEGDLMLRESWAMVISLNQSTSLFLY